MTPFQWKIVLIWCVAVTLVIWSPVLGLIVAAVLSTAFGCRADEGSVHACDALGTDIGPVLYYLVVNGWMILGMWPFMLGSPFVWGFIIHRFRRSRRGVNRSVDEPESA